MRRAKVCVPSLLGSAHCLLSQRDKVLLFFFSTADSFLTRDHSASLHGSLTRGVHMCDDVRQGRGRALMENF